MTITKFLSTILAISALWLGSISPANAEAPSANIVRMNEILEWFVAQPTPPRLSEPDQKSKLLKLWTDDSIWGPNGLTPQELATLNRMTAEIDQLYMQHSESRLTLDHEAQRLNLVKFQDEVILNFLLFIKTQMMFLETAEVFAAAVPTTELKTVRTKILMMLGRTQMYLSEPHLSKRNRNQIMQALTDNATLLGATFGNEERKNLVSVLRRKARVQPDVQKDFMNFLKEMYNAPCNAICEAK
ncbi:hypothetical protein HBA92_19980 [Ochrobactrum sp. MR28]|nr:hypothetical protein [Ochrobactrum sp. MR28]MBX8818662.1 hypothetical protein [Ochrobactrum sp. MR31]